MAGGHLLGLLRAVLPESGGRGDSCCRGGAGRVLRRGQMPSGSPWLPTLEDRVHTRNCSSSGVSKPRTHLFQAPTSGPQSHTYSSTRSLGSLLGLLPLYPADPVRPPRALILAPRHTAASTRPPGSLGIAGGLPCSVSSPADAHLYKVDPRPRPARGRRVGPRNLLRPQRSRTHRRSRRRPT